MSTDGQLRREEWIGAVQAKLFPKLLGDARFKDGKKLADRFERETSVWRKQTNSNRSPNWPLPNACSIRWMTATA